MVNYSSQQCYNWFQGWNYENKAFYWFKSEQVGCKSVKQIVKEITFLFAVLGSLKQTIIYLDSGTQALTVVIIIIQLADYKSRVENQKALNQKPSVWVNWVSFALLICWKVGFFKM